MFYLFFSILLLLALSVFDIKQRLVPIWPPAAYALVLLIVHLILRDLGLSEILTGLVPGAVLLILALMFRASIGSGDGLVTLACGAVLGFSVEFPALVLSLLLCAVYAFVQLIRKKLSGKDALPFLPFLTAGHAALFLAEVIL